MESTLSNAEPLRITRYSSLCNKLSLFARDIKISHTIFAMPFALLSTFIAASGRPQLGQLALIILCMITARTVAMSSNRLLDAKLDALNPRTVRRTLPSGALSYGFFAAILFLCVALFVGSTFLFKLIYANPWPLYLSVPVLLYLSAYPLLKRFTRLCHYYLGAALGLAPVCAWVAMAGRIDWTPVLMAGAVLLWTAGFDIIYACQDYESDIQTGVFSVPSKLGIAKALWVARATHICSVVLLIALGLYSPQLGTLYFIGVTAAITLLVIEHSIVKPNDLSKVGLAFFTINGIISLLLGTLGIIDVILSKN
jgi:4-hydroxybenzoate polyprenyltransferase